MSQTLLIAVMLSLAVSIVLGIIAFVQAGASQKLRGRVQSASTMNFGETVSARGDQPSIRVAERNENPVLVRALRMLRYYPDVPAAYKFPWWGVTFIVTLVGAISATRLQLFVDPLLAVAIATLNSAWMARSIFGWQFGRYRDAAFQQIPDALGLMVRTVRAGLPMAEALRSVSREMPFPTNEEFGRVVGDIAIGRPLDQSLLRMSQRLQLTEYAFLSVTLGLQQQTGGSLAETLDNLADTVRKRVGIAKRANALAAEAKMQAGILAALPFIAALAMSAIQPFYIDTFTQHPTGQKMAVVGFTVMLIGLFIIRWMIKRAGMD